MARLHFGNVISRDQTTRNSPAFVPSWITILFTISVPLIIALGYLLRVGYLHRSKINALRKQGIPMPKEWSWFTGHLLTLQKYVDQIPPDANVNLAMKDLAREYAETEVFLMDFWPVYPPLLMVYSPEAAIQVSTKYNLPKTDMHLRFIKPITGGPNVISMSDNEWKTWRSLFNPGFSTAVMMDNVPHIVDSVQVYCEILKEKAGKANHAFRDADLDYQRSENVLATALGYITRWYSFWDPRILMHPLRPFIQKYYGHVMNKYIRNELDHQFLEIKQEKLSNENSIHSKRAKSVITLALEACVAENQDKNITAMTKLDDDFARYATYQIRLFLFAGNDTTSKTLSLYPPAATMRSGRAGIAVTDRHGNTYPMDHVDATTLHSAVHNNPRVWPRPDKFLPERFLVEPDHELYPNPAAYRPFEQGLRNRIGQTLVYNEMRILMIMTARVIDIKPAYDEWDALKEKEVGLFARVVRKFAGEPIKTVHGDRAYQTKKVGTHPANGYPCHVDIVKQ
ncbi:cytochrome P450 [Zopfia rhizophila CBS 207.26]|uniref:Cytochrome P450 n=1 Tax=Zopfia rhizophila CBS 207.26 TaxID=1314779 RepID=A0A6A6DPP0_9PEZI|nr:cytochrome P450 [Zopfia rhizophila CBS 207.26]